MRLQLIAVGRLKDGPERVLADRYLTRSSALARGLGFAGPDLIELPEARGSRQEERRANEAARIRDKAGPAALVIFDEAAASPTSEAFARHLAECRDARSGSSLALVIGGPDGLDPSLSGLAAWSVSFGRLTLPHGLVRVLVAEQLYRAFTIMAGHPYHRGGGGVA